MGRVVGFMDDLFFQMKVLETAKQLGVEFKVAKTAEGLIDLLGEPTKLVIMDLNARNNPVATLEQLRATDKGIRVIAFLSHVQTELAGQARQAGASQVLARSTFTETLPELLRSAQD